MLNVQVNEVKMTLTFHVKSEADANTIKIHRIISWKYKVSLINGQMFKLSRWHDSQEKAFPAHRRPEGDRSPTVDILT